MILSLFIGVFSIFASHLVLIAGFAGVGILVGRAFGFRRLQLDDCFLAFWVGWAVAVLFLILWNFFLPVGGGTALAIVLGAGCAGLAGARHELTRIFEGGQWRPSWRVMGLLVIAGCWIAEQSLAALRTWDTTIYHLQAVKWASAYPAIPGIANLFGPLGFNNSSVLYAAMLDAGPWAGRANHLANGLLVVVLLYQVILSGARFAGRGSAGGRQIDLFRFLLLAPVANLADSRWLSSFVTDLPLTIVLLAAISLLYSMLTSRNEAPVEDYHLVALVILMSAAVTIKINAAVFAMLGAPLAAGIWLRTKTRDVKTIKRTLGWATAIAGSFALAWVARGMVLSGYPFFPVPVAGLPVDWRIPLEHAQAEYDYIIYSALEFSWNRTLWIKHLAAVPFDLLVPLALAAIAVVVNIIETRRLRIAHRGVAQRSGWWLAAPLLAAISAWLMVAPDPRYAPSMTWGLAALCVVQTYGLSGDRSSKVRQWWALAALCVGVAPPVVTPLWGAWRGDEPFNPIKVVAAYNLASPGPDWGMQPNEEVPRVMPYTTESGVTLNVPLGRCWDAPLPCTPNPAPNLRLRDANNLRNGFRVEGPWAMINWPESWRPDYLAEWRARRAETLRSSGK